MLTTKSLLQPLNVTCVALALFGAACGGVSSSGPSGTDGTGGGTGTGGNNATGGASGTDDLLTIDTAAFCSRLIDTCGATGPVEECEAAYGAMRVTSECLDAIDGSSCDDLRAQTSTSSDICFPLCAAEGSSCNDDGTITKCSSVAGALHQFVIDCADACAYGGADHVWSGVCGKTYESQTSDEDECWCDVP